MKNILNTPFVEEMRKATANMYRLGWDERNGGNISYLLDETEVGQYRKDFLNLQKRMMSFMPPCGNLPHGAFGQCSYNRFVTAAL